MANSEEEYVREYTPRKKEKRPGGRMMDNYNISPEASGVFMSGKSLDDGTVSVDRGAASPDGAITLTTSEIIDFAEGTDSTP